MSREPLHLSCEPRALLPQSLVTPLLLSREPNLCLSSRESGPLLSSHEPSPFSFKPWAKLLFFQAVSLTPFFLSSCEPSLSSKSLSWAPFWSPRHKPRIFLRVVSCTILPESWAVLFCWVVNRAPSDRAMSCTPLPESSLESFLSAQSSSVFSLPSQSWFEFSLSHL